MGRALTVFCFAMLLVLPTWGRADEADTTAEADELSGAGVVDPRSIVAAQAAVTLARDARRSRSDVRAILAPAGSIVPRSLPLAALLIGVVIGVNIGLRRRKPVKHRVAVQRSRPERSCRRPRPQVSVIPRTCEPAKAARVLIVDDSPTSLEHLDAILQAAPGLEVIGRAGDGLEALSLAFLLRPDVIVMDLEMPEMGGVEATARIMKETPTAVAAVSSHFDVYDPQVSGPALRAGAVALLPKPPGPDDADYERSARIFAETIAAVSGSQTARRAA